MTIQEIYKDKKLPAKFQKRLEKYYDELKWLYFELYSGQETYFVELCNELLEFFNSRPQSFKKLDTKREKESDWYKKNDLLGMMMYTDAFADNLEGVKAHLDYIEECNVNYLHLMPLLDTTEGKSDGGYAVSNYRKVQEKLGTMEELKDLAEECHKKNICVCLDYVMNHTSEDHEWAKRARSGESKYRDYYFFYDSYDIPAQYEKTVPQVFPKTAPGNFTWLEEEKQFVMTTFYPYQWDLNYANPAVFNEMTYNLLFLANQGIDVIRIDAVPYIWKELGTNCRNLPQVHTIVRLMRMIAEIVCPGILLLGEVVMEPKELAPYFGTVEKQECHLLYNVTTMATLWHTVATKDVRLLKSQMEQLYSLPKEYSFLNYLRCHDDIGWGLDYAKLKEWGMEEIEHKQFLNDYFLGNYEESTSVGELYNADPVTKDARFCATTASMCGIECAEFEGNREKLQTGIQLDLMLHAFLLFQSGIPVIYSGDEVAAFNDWSYRGNPFKREDSRYIHRGKFNWEKANLIRESHNVKKEAVCVQKSNMKETKENSIEGMAVSGMFYGLSELEQKRQSDTIFSGNADVYAIETHNNAVLGMIRIEKEKSVIGLFNFSSQVQRVWIVELKEAYRNMFEEEIIVGEELYLQPYQYLWLEK